MTEEEFYQKIPEWIGVDKEKWNHVTLFAYFCHKYEQKTGVRFKMVRSKAGPTSTKETRDFAKLLTGYYPDSGCADRKDCRLAAMMKCYNYINWMFDFKMRNAAAVSGSAIFHAPSMMNEFERAYSAHLKTKRAASGIDTLISWIKEEAPKALDRFELSNRDEIALFAKYVENHRSPDSECLMILDKIKEMNLL